MKTLRNQKGLSLIEVTIMLLVLMLLTGVLAPSIFDFVKDAQWVKVKEDCEAIAVTVARLHRDVGCIVTSPAAATPEAVVANCVYAAQATTGIPLVLYSDGVKPAIGTTDASGTAAAAPFSGRQWATAFDSGMGNFGDSMTDQFVTNQVGAAGYFLPGALNAASPFAPLFNKGWRGAYLSSPIGPDPWGSAYLVNVGFLEVEAHTATTSYHNYDTFCISPGQNRKWETNIQLIGAKPTADDFITVISGSTY